LGDNVLRTDRMSVMFTSLALSRPLTLEDGRCLRTLADAGEMVLSLTPDEQAQARWQAVVGALIFEIRSDQEDQGHVAAVTDQVARALSEPPFGSVRLVDSTAAPLSPTLPFSAPVPLSAASPAPVTAPRPASAPASTLTAERASRSGVIAGCEFLSILAVVLTTGMMLLGLR